MKQITKNDLIEFLKDKISAECNVPRGSLDINTEFINFNMDSVKAVYIMDQLEKFMEIELSPLYFWDNPTIDSLSTFLIDKVMEFRSKHP
jgi:acyl carrier protein